MFAFLISQASDEAKFIEALKTDRMRQLVDLQTRIDENLLTESGQKKAFENELQSTLRSILASDDSRSAAFQLACDEDQQVVGVWSHIFLFIDYYRCISHCLYIIIGALPYH